MRILVGISLLLLTLCSCRRERIPLLWEQQESGTTETLAAVRFINEQQGYAVGGDSWYHGVRVETTDGGKTWQANSMGNKMLFGLSFDAQNRGYATGIDGYLFRKVADNDDWSFIRLPYWFTFRDVLFLPDGSGILAGGVAFGNGQILRLNPNFSADEPHLFDHEISALASADGQTVHAVGFGIVLRSDDGGRTWTLLPYDGDFFRGLSFPTPQIGYAVGYYGTILKTTDAGQTWQTLRKGGGLWRKDIPFRDVFFASPERGYLVGEEGTFWRTTNGGDSWQVVSELPDWDFISVHAIGNQGWIVGAGGGILHFID